MKIVESCYLCCYLIVFNQYCRFFFLHFRFKYLATKLLKKNFPIAHTVLCKIFMNKQILKFNIVTKIIHTTPTKICILMVLLVNFLPVFHFLTLFSYFKKPDIALHVDLLLLLCFMRKDRNRTNQLLVWFSKYSNDLSNELMA